MIQGRWCQSVEDYLRKLGYEIYPLGVKGLRSWQLVNVLLREAAVGISPDEMPLIYQGTIPCLLDTYAGRCCGTGVIICFPRRNGELAFADFTMYHDLIKTLKNICEQIVESKWKWWSWPVYKTESDRMQLRKQELYAESKGVAEILPDEAEKLMTELGTPMDVENVDPFTAEALESSVMELFFAARTFEQWFPTYDNKFDRHGFVRGKAKQHALPIKEKLQTVVELEAMLDKSQPAWTDFHKHPSNDCLLSSEACYIR